MFFFVCSSHLLTVNFGQGFIFGKPLACEVSRKSSRNGDITLSFPDLGKSCPSHKFLTLQISLLTPFAKNKVVTKFPDLKYILW